MKERAPGNPPAVSGLLDSPRPGAITAVTGVNTLLHLTLR
jgi:hypothetical protein